MSDLRPQDGVFNKMITVNCAQFWDDPEGTLRTLRERLAPGGVLAITYQPRHPGATDADADRAAERTTMIAEKVGFSNTRVEKLPLKPICVVCMLLTR